MGCQSNLDKFLNFRCNISARSGIGLEDNKGFYNFGTHLVRAADNCHHAHGRMFHNAVFNFGRPDAVTGAGNDIILTADKPKIPLLIVFGQIARQTPFANILISGGCRIFPVFQKHDRVGSLNGHLADRA